MSETLRVLLVEDNQADVDLIRGMLPHTGPVSFRIESVLRLSEALTRLKDGDIDLVLLDLGLPDSQGILTFQGVRKAAPGVPIIVLSGNVDQELAVTAVREGAQDYLVKGEVVGNVVVRAARYAIARKREEDAIQEGIAKVEASRRALLSIVEDQKRTEERLRQSEEALRQLNAQLEQRVRDRTAALEAANRELESFAYSVSHDLRAPLRAMDGFSKVLLEEWGGRMDGEGRANLERIRGAAQRMAALIDALLDLSRLSRQQMERCEVDVSEMVSAIAADLSKAEPERRIEWVIQPDVRAQADGPLVRVALENLLDNAAKFTSRTPVARIEFGTRDQGGERSYFVRDNGAGFDMAYVDKLFGPFQRLHPASEFKGNGIGLATVQRVVVRHGGRVRGEGAVGKGAMFSFTLGEQEARHG